MGHFKPLSILVLFTSIFLMAVECEDECDKCQSSIDHMYEKIDAQGCNPNTMQKAWDRIREDCDHFDSAVGLMAETCSIPSANTARPSCNLPSISMAPYNIVIRVYIENQLEQNANIIVNIRDHSSVFEIEPKSSRMLFTFSPEDFIIIEGDLVEVIAEIVPESGELQEVGRSSETFTFRRPGFWDIERSVDILLRQNSTHIRFNVWD